MRDTPPIAELDFADTLMIGVYFQLRLHPNVTVERSRIQLHRETVVEKQRGYSKDGTMGYMRLLVLIWAPTRANASGRGIQVCDTCSRISVQSM